MTTLRSTMRRTAEAGMTLVELMVAVLLASILTGGLFYMMSGQQMTYGQQINNTQTQHSLWGTMSFLQRWLRSAGYGFGACPGGRPAMKDPSDPNKTIPSPLVALQVYNHCNLLVTDPASCPKATDGPADSFTVTAVHPTRLATASMPTVILAAAWTSSADKDLEIRVSPDFPHQFTIGPPADLALLWDPIDNHCLLLEVTGQDAGKLTHADKEPYNGSADFFLFNNADGYSEVTRVTRIAPESRPRHFAVDPATRRLMTWTSLHANPSASGEQADLEVVADQIEDLQLSWACDVDNDGNLGEGTIAGLRQTDEWAFNVATDTVPACGGAPIGAVRVTLIGRSDSEVPGAVAGKIPAAEDENRAAAPMDRFARTVLTTTVQTVNLRVKW